MSSVILSLVIDADIARSSGLTEHPVSSGSRQLLESVAGGGHILVMCPTLRSEWKTHKSGFATRWMAAMFARKKIQLVNPTPNITNHITEKVADGKEKEIALKDSHLLDAAIEADKIVASNDDRARSAFCNIATGKKEIGNIMWLNAVADKDVFQEKILTGQFVPKEFYLTPPA